MKTLREKWFNRLRLSLLVLSLIALVWPGFSSAARADAGLNAFEQGDFAAAFKAWQGPAERGSKNAQFYLGYLYDTGQGVAEDNKTAAGWYRKAAVQGQATAQFNLAAMYANGDGVAQDRVLAYMLFELAARSDPDAVDEQNRLLPHMTPLQVARANRLARLARRGDMAALLGQAEATAFSDAEGPTTAGWQLWSERDQVAMAQRSLTELGYDPGPVDGAMGGRTAAALEAFQTKAGLPVDGKVSGTVLEALYAAFDSRLGAEELLYGQGLLWRLEKGDAAPSYLFGTMHTNDPRVLDLPRELTRAFFRADTIVLEVEFYSQASYNALGGDSIESLLIDDGRTLRQIVGRDLYSDIIAALTPFGMPEEVLQQMKPWGVYHILKATAQGIRRSQGNGLFLDLWLGQKAVHHGKTLVGLETAEEQFSIFAGLSDQNQIELLDSAIAYSSDGGFTLEEMTELYLASDLTAIFRRVFEPARRLGPKAMLAVVERMLDNRNAVMVERMGPLLDQGNAFIAVGAAHLPGEAGILKLLVDQGYKVAKVY